MSFFKKKLKTQVHDLDDAQPRRYALFISSLDAGGAERVMSILANAWVKQNIEIHLITLWNVSDAYPLEPGVRRVILGLAGPSRNMLHGLFANMRRFFALRRTVRAARPDVLISFGTTTNLLAVLACAGLRLPVILGERIFLGSRALPGIWRGLFRPLYRRAAAVVAQTRRGADDLQARLQRPVAVIANPVVLQADGEDAQAELPRYPARSRTVLAAGRLSAQKGFDLLIDAFARVAADHPEWDLCILGEGPLRSALTAQAAALGVGTRVHLPGRVAHPQAWMRRADLFVLSSRFEGLPNVLLEAMANGMPCLSFDCATGPAELIEHGVDGWLVPPEDVGALATAMGTLMADEALRHRLGAAAAKIADRYSMDAVLAQWDALIASVLPPAGAAHHEHAAVGDAGTPSRERS